MASSPPPRCGKISSLLSVPSAAGYDRFPAKNSKRLPNALSASLAFAHLPPNNRLNFSPAAISKSVAFTLATDSSAILILDEPTRGIDVGAHAEIIRLIETLCADGLALLVISSELEELVGYADRVIIMRDRKQVAEIPLAELSVPAIMNAIAA